MNQLGSILIVDDHLPLLRNLAFLLEVTGFEVLTAANGFEALRILETDCPDLVISDVEMPIMNGFDLLDAMRSNERWQAIPFIFASVRYDLDDLMYGLDLGANDYVPKPYDIFDILDAIHRTTPAMIGAEVLRERPLAS